MAIFFLGKLFKKTAVRWLQDDAFSLSAALAYYAVFSMAPLLIIITVLVGLVHNGNTVDQVRNQFSEFVTPEAADFIARGIVAAASTMHGGIAYTAFALILMLIGASAFTHQLQIAIEKMWNVPPQPEQGIIATIKCRMGTLVIVFASGILLQLVVVVSSGISIYGRHLNMVVPGMTFVWQWVDYAVSFAVVTAIFGLIYKLLPKAKLEWRDVFVGAIVTGMLFSAGKWGIAIYLSGSSFQTIYGAAGTVMILLAWLYYSSLILLFGAEFTQVWVESRGRCMFGRKSASFSLPPRS